ncbi:phosphoinositide phosphatase SAC2-like [Papaver somniferum]|uniref:phosphoinositide phosphatase SAC2-like n=1 Tax=Papaver somniferum TaxID=3469 RepID=UPI000E704149|nr:phosphoinositide phosphatase SAC2-like [Papaver somniferum]
MTGDYELKKAGGSEELDQLDPKDSFLMNFRLYETQSRFYMVGRNKSKTIWRIMKINRSEPNELNIVEDATTYSEAECFDLLTRLREGNVRNGGLKLVTTCYGIIGFIKFLGPYYMLIITKRKQIGVIDGHVIYAISKSEMIPIPYHSVQTDKNENRYKKLLCSIDLTKDFFFSYSYHVMRSLQKNLCDAQTGPDIYENMFVWNEFLTRGIRHNLENTLWTVALVYGFFKQEKLSVSGRDFYLTLISRRSRHYAGTRYRKRGVDEKGRVANDVETEQIVFEDLPEGYPVEISSVVQHRGSIPLFWSQETSPLIAKPKIKLSRRDRNYKATRLHFDNLVTRYGKPIIILNLIKAREKKPRESILRGRFSYATEVINKDLSFENRLRFFHLDLHKLSKSKGANVLESLSGVTEYSLRMTGFFHSQLKPNSVPNEDNENHLIKQPKLQKGVLRTNCIDCLDRTNVAQYSYGLAALGYQLNALGLINRPKIGHDDPLGVDLMELYEMMGDILSLQYGGSLAHCKIFWFRRGRGKAAVHTQDIVRSFQRYLSNAYTDAEKQDAINIFLGYFQPRQGRPALWELDADQHFNVGMRNDSFDENARLSFQRSASAGNLVSASDNPMLATIFAQRYEGESSLRFDDSAPECSTSRCAPSMTTKQLYTDMLSSRIHFYENKDSHNCFDFGTPRSENSYAGDLHERYPHHLFDQPDWPDFASDRPDGYCSSVETSCTGNLSERYEDFDINVLRGETVAVPRENDSIIQKMTAGLGLSYAYWYWVTYGDTLDMPR